MSTDEIKELQRDIFMILLHAFATRNSLSSLDTEMLNVLMRKAQEASKLFA